MIRKAFTEHPATVGETYGEHLVTATRFGFRMVVGGLACMLHGVFPFLFIKTGSREIEDLHKTMVINRSKLPDWQDFII